MFLINGADLKLKYTDKFLDKYADDSYLIVGASNEASIVEELDQINHCAIAQNLKLNRDKSKEIIFYQSGNYKQLVDSLPSTPGLLRCCALKILGVTIQDNFSLDDLVSQLCISVNQAFYAIKILKNAGLPFFGIQQVFHALILSRLTYASPAWWGFASQNNRQKL